MTMERTIFVLSFLQFYVSVLFHFCKDDKGTSTTPTVAMTKYWIMGFSANGKGKRNEMKRKSHRHTWQTLLGNKHLFQEGNIVFYQCVCVCVEMCVCWWVTLWHDQMYDGEMIVITCISPHIVHKHILFSDHTSVCTPSSTKRKIHQFSDARETLLAITVCTNRRYGIYHYCLFHFHSECEMQNAMQIVADLLHLINSVQALSVDSFIRWTIKHVGTHTQIHISVTLY